jgi:glycosyltransferase involved in cell wall biosynthesis
MAVGLSDRPVVLYGMTSGVSARGFIAGQAGFLRERGWRVALVCSDEGDVACFAAADGIRYLPVDLARNPSLRHDLRGVASLWRVLGEVRPAVTVWGSPKASLLGVAACRLRGIPSLYLIHGLRLEGASGVRRSVLRAAEALTCRMASVVVADGFELRALAEDLRLMPAGRIRVLADGSANGVGPHTAAPRYRGELGIPDDAVVVTFAGRITRDKGIRELVAAWRVVASRRPEAHLVVAGRVDGPDPAGPELEAALGSLPRAHLVGHVDDLDRLWSDSDVCVLPSHREGLPLVVIEAAAAGVPAVVCDFTGGRETVRDGDTGRVVPRRDAGALAAALEELVADGRLRRRLGDAARERALAAYDRPRLWSALEQTLAELVGRP